MHLKNALLASSFHKEIEVKAICLKDSEIERKLKENHSLRKTSFTSNYYDLINDKEINTIINAAPTNIAYNINRETLKAKKHLFTEKPAAMTLDEIKELRDMQREIWSKDSTLKVAVNYCRRYDRNYSYMEEARMNGTLGNVELINIFTKEPDFVSREFVATSGGIFKDINVHDFDTSRFISGSEVTRIYALGKVLFSDLAREFDLYDTNSI